MPADTQNADARTEQTQQQLPRLGILSSWWRQELLDANPLNWRRNVLPLDIGQRRLYFDDQSMERCVMGPYHLHPIAGLKFRLELP